MREIRGPAYDNRTCPTMLESRNCEKYGEDQDFLNWRWQPHGCDLPRFDAGEFLRMVKGKTMFFVGDSLARNHVESLLCLLSQVITFFCLIFSPFTYLHDVWSLC